MLDRQLDLNLGFRSKEIEYIRDRVISANSYIIKLSVYFLIGPEAWKSLVVRGRDTCEIRRYY